MAAEPTAAARRRSPSAALPWLLLAVLACLPYGQSFGYGFLDYDDPSAIVNLPLIRSLSLAGLPAFFEPNVYAGLPEYMPLKNLSYAVDYALFGLSPQHFRLQQQFWYVCSVLLAFGWLAALLRRSLPASAPSVRLAWFAAALFALHPSHVESVVWLSGRKDVLSGSLLLASLCAALRWPGAGAGVTSRGRGWFVTAVVCAALALLAKPTAVVLPGLLLLQDALGTPGRGLWSKLRPRLWLHVVIGALCLAFLALYLHVTARYAGAWAGQEWRHFDGPAPLRWGQQLLLMLQMACWPVQLAVVHPPSVLDAQPWSAQVVLGVLTLLGLLAGLLRALQRGSIWALPLGVFLIPLAPVVLAPAWQQYVAGRYLFHAALGACLAFSLGLHALAAQRPRLNGLVTICGLALGLSWGAATHQYAASFRDPLSLWQGTLAVYPRFGWAYAMASRAALAGGDVERALGLLGQCLEAVPDEARCQARLGRLLLPVEPARGEALLRAALPQDPDGEAHQALAERLANTGRADEAVTLYTRWLSGRPSNTDQIASLARLQLAAGQREAALRTARQALEAMALNAPAAPPPLALLLELALGAGRPELAQRLRASAAHCARADCFAANMRW
jgi:tetratricopeptide (TPR) repeat protein